jgi:hypothetical protein
MTQTLQPTTTREQWLEAAVQALRPIFAEIDVELPPVRVSVGWPSRGGTANKGRVIGQCWKTSVASDGVAQIFISPVLGGEGADPVEQVHMLGVLAHELIHAWDDCDSGHRGSFAKAARNLGLVGKMTCTTVGEELAEQLLGVLAEVGPYPHAPLDFAEMEKQRKPQTTRMLKLECPEDGYIVRTTAKWLEVGYPTCPCGTEMEAAG